MANLKSEVDRSFRALNIGVITGTAFTGSFDALVKFRDLLISRCETESIRLAPIDISGQWIVNPGDDVELGPDDLIVVWGLECLDPHDNRAYSLRTQLDMIKHTGGPHFVIFCQEDYYRKHFCDYSAPFYQFCLKYPVG